MKEKPHPTNHIVLRIYLVWAPLHVFSLLSPAFGQLSSACPTNTVTITKYLFFVYFKSLNPFKQRISSEI